MRIFSVDLDLLFTNISKESFVRGTSSSPSFNFLYISVQEITRKYALL